MKSVSRCAQSPARSARDLELLKVSASSAGAFETRMKRSGSFPPGKPALRSGPCTRNGGKDEKGIRFRESKKKNPYAKRLKKSITIRLDQPTVKYFRRLAEEAELPYQSLINLYLRDCAASNRRP